MSINCNKGRVLALDGLRGLACLSVVCFHFLNETFGQVIPIVSNPITNFFFDGPLAVCLFFIISGEAISSSFFKSGSTTALIRTAIKRIPRLSIPVLFASLFTIWICRENLFYSPLVRDLLNKADWRAFTSLTNINFLDILKFSFFSVYSRFKGDSINPFLWTMRYELLGSALLLSLLYSIKNKKFSLVFIFVLYFVSKKENILHNFNLLFLVGSLFSYIRNNREIEKIFQLKHKTLIFILFIFSFSLFCNSLYYNKDFSMLKSILIYALIFFSIDINNFLKKSFVQFLGKISFPLFLIQHQILISFECFLIFKLHHHIQNLWIALFVFAFSLSICLLCAYIFSPIEKITNTLCNFIYNFLISFPKNIRKTKYLIHIPK